jgi:hypothetical protein
MTTGSFIVSASRTRYKGTAECERCTLDPDTTRAGCRAHVRQTGHMVWFVVEDSTRYKPATQPEEEARSHDEPD